METSIIETTKGLQSAEEAQEYIKKVNDLLSELIKLSSDAGLYSHAAVWCGINAAFIHSPEEFQIIVDMIGMYLEASEKRYNP